MTVRYTADVFCDNCGDWVHGVTSAKSVGIASAALKAAKAGGWSRDVKSAFMDLCPKCLIEHRSTTNNH